MGTSKSFSDTRHAMMPNWKDLQSTMTMNCDTSNISDSAKSDILSDYVAVVGGSSRAGRGKSRIAGQGGIRAAKNLGSFFGSFSGSGNDLRRALAETGLTNLEGKTVDDVINHLINYCSKDASTIDDIAAKEATRKILEDLVEGAENIEDMEALLTNKFQKETSEEIIIKYFGYYIYEHLDKWFYEHLIKTKGVNECNNLFNEIKDFIFETLEEVQRRNSLANIDWSSNEGDRLIKNIQEDILTVFA